MFKFRRRRKKRPEIIDWDKSRPPTNYPPVGFPFVTCRPMSPGRQPCVDNPCQPMISGTCYPGTIFYPTTLLPSVTCIPAIPPGCVPRPK